MRLKSSSHVTWVSWTIYNRTYHKLHGVKKRTRGGGGGGCICEDNVQHVMGAARIDSQQKCAKYILTVAWSNKGSLIMFFGSLRGQEFGQQVQWCQQRHYNYKPAKLLFMHLSFFLMHMYYTIVRKTSHNADVWTDLQHFMKSSALRSSKAPTVP